MSCCGSSDHNHDHSDAGKSSKSEHGHGRGRDWLEYGIRLAALVAWASVMLYFTYHGELQIFLAPIFQKLAAIGAHLLGLVAIVYGIVGRPGQESEEFCCEHHLDTHAGSAIFAGLVLILPVSLAAMTSPESFSESVLRNRGAGQIDPATLTKRQKSPESRQLQIDSPYISEGDDSEEMMEPEPGDEALSEPVQSALERSIDQYIAQIPRDKQGYLQMTTLDLLYGAENEVLRRKLEEDKVALVGQYLQEPVQEGEGTKDLLVRMMMVCCAADAQPASVRLVNTQRPEGVNNAGWVRVRGKPVYAENAEGFFDVHFRSDDVRKTEMPDDPFLY